MTQTRSRSGPPRPLDIFFSRARPLVPLNGEFQNIRLGVQSFYLVQVEKRGLLGSGLTQATR